MNGEIDSIAQSGRWFGPTEEQTCTMAVHHGHQMTSGMCWELTADSMSFEF